MTTLYLWNDRNAHRKPQKLQIDHQVQSISSGFTHTLIQTQYQLLGMGDSSEGQLGNDEGDQNTDNITSIQIPFLKTKIQSIACGSYHSLILDANGQVYSAGAGRNAVLGYGRGSNSYTFQSVLSGIQQISAGNDHSLARSSIKVYGWGSSKDGQLGLIKEQLFYQPQQLFVFASYFIYAGPRCSIFGTQQGTYATGFNENGQLGLGHQKKVRMAKKVSINDKIVECHGNSSFILYKTQKCQFYASGKSCFGHFLFPTKIKNLKNSKQVCISQNLGLRIDQDNNVYRWDPKTDASMKKICKLDEEGCIYKGCNGVIMVGNMDVFNIETNEQNQVGRQQNTIRVHQQKRVQNRFDFSEISDVRRQNHDLSEDQCRKPNASEEQIGEEINTPLFTRNITKESRSPQKSQSLIDSYHNIPTVSFQRRRSIEELSSANQQKYSSYSQQYLLAKIQALQNSSRQKDTYIKQIRTEFSNLLQMVQSQEHLKHIASMKNPNYLNQVRATFKLEQQPDRFEQTAQKLRDLLKQSLG